MKCSYEANVDAYMIDHACAMDVSYEFWFGMEGWLWKKMNSCWETIIHALFE